MNKDKLREEWRLSNLYPMNRDGILDERMGNYIADWWLSVLDQQLKATLEEIEDEFRKSEMLPNNSGYIGVKEAKEWIYNLLASVKERV